MTKRNIEYLDKHSESEMLKKKGKKRRRLLLKVRAPLLQYSANNENERGREE